MLSLCLGFWALELPLNSFFLVFTHSEDYEKFLLCRKHAALISQFFVFSIQEQTRILSYADNVFLT